MDPETLGTIAKDNRNIKGIRYDRRIPGSIDDCLGDIEMLSTNCVAEAMAPLCSCLKQLYIRYSNERTLAIVSQHLHLERLHIHDFVGNFETNTDCKLIGNRLKKALRSLQFSVCL